MTHCLRPILLGGVLLFASACTTAEDFQIWKDHSTQYASGRHMAFSTRNVGAKRLKVTETDLADAQKEQWWGKGLPGALYGEGVPWTLRLAGSMGVRVWVKVEGNDVYIQEATAKRPFSAEFTVQGDKMTGHFRNSNLPVLLELARRP